MTSPSYRTTHTPEELLATWDSFIERLAPTLPDPETSHIFELADLRTRVLIAATRYRAAHPDRAADVRVIVEASVTLGLADGIEDARPVERITRCACGCERPIPGALRAIA